MSIETLLQSFLIHVVSNEANATTQNEQRVDSSNVDVLLCFLAEVERKSEKVMLIFMIFIILKQNKILPRESSTIPQHINETAGDDSVNVENEIWFFTCSNFLDFKSIFQQWLSWEIL